MYIKVLLQCSFKSFIIITEPVGTELTRNCPVVKKIITLNYFAFVKLINVIKWLCGVC